MRDGESTLTSVPTSQVGFR